MNPHSFVFYTSCDPTARDKPLHEALQAFQHETTLALDNTEAAFTHWHRTGEVPETTPVSARD